MARSPFLPALILAALLPPAAPPARRSPGPPSASGKVIGRPIPISRSRPWPLPGPSRVKAVRSRIARRRRGGGPLASMWGSPNIEPCRKDEDAKEGYVAAVRRIRWLGLRPAPGAGARLEPAFSHEENVVCNFPDAKTGKGAWSSAFFPNVNVDLGCGQPLSPYSRSHFRLDRTRPRRPRSCPRSQDPRLHCRARRDLAPPQRPARPSICYRLGRQPVAYYYLPPAALCRALR